MGLWSSLRFPRATLRRVADHRRARDPLPYATWGALTGIAVAGSAVYGASLSLVLPRWRPTGGALWLALSAGAGWCVFGPALVVVTRRDPFVLAHACLVTMAYGEGVLVGGACSTRCWRGRPSRGRSAQRRSTWAGLASPTS